MPPATVQGPVDSVPCPHCGKTNDFRQLDDVLDTGTDAACDHCHGLMRVAAIRDIKIVAVHGLPGKMPVPQSVQPAMTIAPGALRRFLKR